MELTHIGRLVFDLMPNCNVQKPLYCQALKFKLENARRRNQRFDITDYPYNHPMQIMKKYQHYFSDDVLSNLQNTLLFYLKLTKTQTEENISKLLRALFQNRKWYRYLLNVFRFLVANLPSPFVLCALNILKPGETWNSWKAPMNQIQFKIK